MVVGAKVYEHTDGFLFVCMWFVCGLYVGILTSPLNNVTDWSPEIIQLNRRESSFKAHTTRRLTTPIMFLMDRLLVWDTRMYRFNTNRHYNWPIVAPIVAPIMN